MRLGGEPGIGPAIRQKIEIGGKTPYQKWAEGQGIPIIRDFYIEDLR